MSERIELFHRSFPRYAWHRPPWDYDLSQGLLAYQPAQSAEGSGEAEAIRDAFGGRKARAKDVDGPVQREGILWLAPDWGEARSWATRGYRHCKVDLSKLDPERLRYSYGAEGYVWHLGPIPVGAFTVEPLWLILKTT